MIQEGSGATLSEEGAESVISVRSSTRRTVMCNRNDETQQNDINYYTDSKCFTCWFLYCFAYLLIYLPCWSFYCVIWAIRVISGLIGQNEPSWERIWKIHTSFPPFKHRRSADTCCKTKREQITFTLAYLIIQPPPTNKKWRHFQYKQKPMRNGANTKGVEGWSSLLCLLFLQKKREKREEQCFILGALLRPKMLWEKKNPLILRFFWAGHR